MQPQLLQPELVEDLWLTGLALLHPRNHYRDGLDQLVPRRLRGVFEVRDEILRGNERLREFESLVGIMCDSPACRHIDAAKVLRHLQLARAELYRGLPWTLCYCGGSVECSLCEGDGWVSQKEDLGPRPRSVVVHQGRLLSVATPEMGVDGTEVAETQIQTDSGAFRIKARGLLALRLSEFRSLKDPVEVEGKLKVFTLPDGDGKIRELVVTQVTAIRAIPLEQWNDGVPGA